VSALIDIVTELRAFTPELISIPARTSPLRRVDFNAFSKECFINFILVIRTTKTMHFQRTNQKQLLIDFEYKLSSIKTRFFKD
jgi:hypothetical protein